MGSHSPRVTGVITRYLVLSGRGDAIPTSHCNVTLQFKGKRRKYNKCTYSPLVLNNIRVTNIMTDHSSRLAELASQHKVD